MKYNLVFTDESGAHEVKFRTLRNMMKMHRYMEAKGCICSWSLIK